MADRPASDTGRSQRRCMMTVLSEIKSFFKRSKTRAKAEEVKPAAKSAEGEVAKAPESKAEGASEQKAAGGA